MTSICTECDIRKIPDRHSMCLMCRDYKKECQRNTREANRINAVYVCGPCAFTASSSAALLKHQATKKHAKESTARYCVELTHHALQQALADVDSMF